MQEVKRTYRFEREYLNHRSENSKVVTEVEVDFSNKTFFIDNVTTHNFHGHCADSHLPKMVASLEIQLEAIYAVQELLS